MLKNPKKINIPYADTDTNLCRLGGTWNQSGGDNTVIGMYHFCTLPGEVWIVAYSNLQFKATSYSFEIPLLHFVPDQILCVFRCVCVYVTCIYSHF